MWEISKLFPNVEGAQDGGELSLLATWQRQPHALLHAPIATPPATASSIFLFYFFEEKSCQVAGICMYYCEYYYAYFIFFSGFARPAAPSSCISFYCFYFLSYFLALSASLPSPRIVIQLQHQLFGLLRLLSIWWQGPPTPSWPTPTFVHMCL